MNSRWRGCMAVYGAPAHKKQGFNISLERSFDPTTVIDDVQRMRHI